MSVYSNELLSSSSLTAYPFRDDAGVPARVYRLFCDAVVSIPHGFGFSASISSISVDPGGMSFVLTVCGDRMSFFAPVSDKSYYRVEAEDFFSVVVDVDHIRDSEPFSDSSEYPLVESCANFVPRTVDSLSLMKIEEKGGEPVLTASDIRGNVVFVNGTNSNVVATDLGIELNAVPGAGTGRVPCECPETDDDATIPSIVPESTGDVVIDGDGCIQVNTDNSSTVTLEGRCTACCPTSKYSEELDKMKGLRDSISDIYAGVMDITERFNKYVTWFNEFLKEPSEDEMVVSMTIMAPIPRAEADNWGNNRVKGKHQRVMANTNITNASQKEVSIRVSLPSCQGMDLVSCSVSPSIVLPNSSRSTSDTGDVLKIPAGGSMNVYSVFVSPNLVSYMGNATYTARQLVEFSWLGKVLDGERIVTREMTVLRTASASCTVSRG